jgi:elongation factor Tu
MDLPHLSVGTLGHFKHGKTTLSAAITRALAKRHGGVTRPLSVEEISKGGFLPRAPWRPPASDGSAFRGPNTWEGWERCTTRPEALYYETERRRYTHLDFPGHFSRWRSTAAALSLLDAAVLVVSAVDSAMPQTREHLLLARQAGLSRLVVFLSFCDRAGDAELLDLAEIETRELLSSCGFPGDSTPVIRGAGLPAYEGDPRWEEPIYALIQALDAVLEPPREAEGPALMLIHRVYSFAGRATIAEGRLIRGVLRRGDPLELIGWGEARATRAGGLEISHRAAEEARAGDYLAAHLPGIGRGEIRRGQALSPPGALKPGRRFACDLYLLTREEGGRHTPIFDTDYTAWRSPHQSLFSLGTASVSGRVRFRKARVPENPNPGPETLMAMPGDHILGAEVELLAPVYLREGMGFSFRDGCDGLRAKSWGERRWGGTAGGGVITRIEDDEKP